MGWGPPSIAVLQSVVEALLCSASRLRLLVVQQTLEVSPSEGFYSSYRSGCSSLKEWLGSFVNVVYISTRRQAELADAWNGAGAPSGELASFWWLTLG